MILANAITLDELIHNGNNYYPDMIKFCIDKKRKVVSIDEEMHIDMENELYDNGSDPNDIFGGNIMIDSDPPSVVWEAHPNIERNRMIGGRGRLITDVATLDELSQILYQFVK